MTDHAVYPLMSPPDPTQPMSQPDGDQYPKLRPYPIGQTAPQGGCGHGREPEPQEALRHAGSNPNPNSYPNPNRLSHKRCCDMQAEVLTVILTLTLTQQPVLSSV